MESGDIDRVWALLGKCRLGDQHLKDVALKGVWALILEPYRYEDVKQAVAAHFRVSKFWPDVGEVTQYLPDVPTPKDLRERAKHSREIQNALGDLRRLAGDAERGRQR